MELTHTFTVPASLDTTWAAFNDIAGVANCFPGAAVTSVEEDEFKGTVKVKLGPISLTYNGSGSFVEKDESAGRFVVEAKGKDRRGGGTAAATVTATMAAASDDSTDVEVLTDLSITGRPAQFGRGVIQDVSDKLLQQFIACLEQKLGGGAGAPSPAEGAAAVAGGAVAGAAEEAAAAAAAGEVGATASGEPAAEPPGAEVPGAEVPAPGPPAAGSGTPAGSGAPAPEVAVTGGPIGDGAAPEGAASAASAASAVDGVASPAVEALDLGATVLPILLRRYWKAALITVAGLTGLLALLRFTRRR